MSALRFSRPGIAGTTLVPVDDGCAVRATGHRFDLMGDIYMAPAKTLAQPGSQKGRTVVYKPYTGPRCGYVLPLVGEPCYRRPHTGRDHRSEAAVTADIKRRRGKRREPLV